MRRMTTQRSAPGRAVRERLADEVIETYVSWREACVAVERSYAEWCRALRDDRRLAHAVFVAALDGEETAAETHREAVEHVVRALGAD
jgi:predicted lipoprotein